MPERAAYSPVSPPATLEEYVRLQNARLPRLAAHIERVQRLRSRVISADDTLTESDDVVLVDTSGGDVTATLPIAATVPGKMYKIKKMEAANTMTIAASGSDTIDGGATSAVTVQYASRDVVSAETSIATYNWVIT